MRRHIGKASETFVGALERDRVTANGLFGVAAGGVVQNEGEHAETVGRVDWGQSDLGGELRSVLSNRPQVSSGPHEAFAGVSDEAVSQTLMVLPGVNRSEQIDRRPDQSIALITEHPFAFVVDELNHATRVNHQHRRRTSLDDESE